MLRINLEDYVYNFEGKEHFVKNINAKAKKKNNKGHIWLCQKSTLQCMP